MLQIILLLFDVCIAKNCRIKHSMIIDVDDYFQSNNYQCKKYRSSLPCRIQMVLDTVKIIHTVDIAMIKSPSK